MRLERWVYAAFVLILGTTACDRSADSGEVGDEGEPQTGGTVTLVEIADLDKPFPFIETTNTDAEVSDMMYMSLLNSSWTNGRLVFHTSDEDPKSISKSYEFFGPDSASTCSAGCSRRHRSG
jgi:hypothetical protein